MSADVAQRPRLVRTGPDTWEEAVWSRGLCVFCPRQLADGDVIACSVHRGELDRIVMPWDGKEAAF